MRSRSPLEGGRGVSGRASSLLLLWLLCPAPAAAQQLLLAGDLQLEHPPALTALKPYLTGIDHVLVNLEGPLSTRPFAVQQQWKLRSSPTLAPRLAELSSNVIGVLANNHAGDCGPPGLDETRQALGREGLTSAGDPDVPETAEEPGFTLVTGNLVSHPEAELIPSVRACRQGPVVVWLHWNPEEWLLPDETERNLAHQLVDAGARLVVGTHPHLPGPVERYGNALIFYSLGNLAVECPCSQLSEGVVARVSLNGPRTEGQLLTVQVGNLANGLTPRPQALPGLLEALRDLSAELDTTLEPDGRVR